MPAPTARETMLDFAKKPGLRYMNGSIVAWLCDPPGAVVQIARPVKLTSEIASWLTGHAFALLDRRFPGRNDLRLVLDFRVMTGRSATSRSVLLEAAKRLGARFARIVIVPPLAAPPMYLNVLQATAALLREAGVHLEIAESLESVLEQQPMRAID